MTQENSTVKDENKAQASPNDQDMKNAHKDVNRQNTGSGTFAGGVQQERMQTAGNAEATVVDVKKGSHAELWRAIKFTLFSISAGVIEIILYTILDLVTLLNMLCNFVLEYLYDRYFVFGKSIDTNERAQKTAGEDEKRS